MQATLEAKFVAAQDGRGDWFAKIRPPTPTQASARDAVLARGGTPRANASFETLKETLDQMCEDIVRSDEPEVRFGNVGTICSERHAQDVNIFNFY